MLPAASFVNTGAPPEAGCAVEIEKTSAATPRRLFQKKVTIEKHRLHPGEQRIATVEMPPARLDHANFWIGKEMNGAFEQIGLRHKIGVENTNEVAGGGLQAGRECTRLK